MTPIPVREVSRDTIVTAAKEAIAVTRDRAQAVSTPLARRLLKVARTHDRFMLGSWYRGDCGCLVGNLHGPDIDAGRLTEAEYLVGIHFEESLLHLRANPHPRTILEVTS